jgi:hypothetical protein
MCVELRIRCSQPPSRGLPGSLPSLPEPSPRSVEMGHQLGDLSLAVDARESASAEERRVSLGLSLQGIFGGHTCEEADGPHHHPSIMMSGLVRRSNLGLSRITCPV